MLVFKFSNNMNKDKKMDGGAGGMGDEMMGLGMGGAVDYGRGHENAFDYCK